MTAETLGGHIANSLKRQLEKMEKAVERPPADQDRAADELMAELDRLTALLVAE